MRNSPLPAAEASGMSICHSDERLLASATQAKAIIIIYIETMWSIKNKSPQILDIEPWQVYISRMLQNGYSLKHLSDATGIEERTIRSYIERGLLPGAQARGRAATYSKEHLSRLHVIRSLRRARPNIGLSEIRIFLQNLSPEQIDRLAAGQITAAPRVIDASIRPDGADSQDAGDDDHEIPRTIDGERSAASLTGVERLVCLLREFSGFTPLTPTSKVERWQRIAVTPDIELSVRAGLDDNLMAAFRELADLLRNLLQRTDALSTKGDE